MEDHHIVVLGGAGVGKTALSTQFINHVFLDEYDPVIGEEYRKQAVIDGSACMICFDSEYTNDDECPIRDALIRRKEGFLCVYSITSRESFEKMKRLVRKVMEYRGTDKFPVVIVGNKLDCEGERQVPVNEGQEFASSVGFMFMESSARTRVNVDEAFYALVRVMRRFKGISPPKKQSRSGKNKCLVQ